MNYIIELARFMHDTITSEHAAHAIRHLSQHAFQHFMQHHAPGLWQLVKDNFAEVYAFVQDWVAAYLLS